MNFLKKKMCLFLLIFIGIIAFQSCNKDEVQENEDTLDLQAENTKRSPIVLDNPLSSKDVYEFRDSEHFFQYLRDLQDVIDSDYDRFRNEVSQDFQNLESRDPNIVTIYQRMSNDEFVDPNDRFMSDIADPVIQSIVNLQYEVKVGDAMLTYMNDKQIFMADASDSNTRNTIATIRNGDIIKYNNVPPNVTVAQDDDIQSLPFGICKCNIRIEKTDCNTVRVFGNCKDLLWGSGEATVTITFNVDGTNIVTTQTNRIDGNFEFFFDISNFNSVVVFNANVDPDCVFGSTKFIINWGVEPSSSVCDAEERKTPWGWKQDSGVQAISYRTQYRKGFWAGYEQTKVFSYHWNGSKWNNTNSKLTATIDATRKSLVCGVQNSESETKSCNSCKDIQASVNDNYYWHCDGDVIGTLKKELNWNGNSWSIDATQSVDFECCE
jgi:hypothetical protein